MKEADRLRAIKADAEKEINAAVAKGIKALRDEGLSVCGVRFDFVDVTTFGSPAPEFLFGGARIQVEL